MSKVVKEWQPTDGCQSCKDARRIMNDQMRISAETHSLAMKKIRLQAERIKELEGQLKETKDNNLPPELLDLVRFLADTWDAVDKFVYEHCDGEALAKYPVVQGARNQINLRKIGDQAYDPKRRKEAVKWLLDK